jgi:SpoVK/Ycf46/Vps4 family AAA+-type ATPase
VVIAGGELTLAALDLVSSLTTGFYRAPLQLLANGGVLILDDFGRQHVSPAALLNRWMVPLENRVDYLTFQSGQKCAVPFDVFVIFATNLQPNDLVDEAFLRRIQHKVLAESPTPAEFTRIFDNYCRSKQLDVEPQLAQCLIDRELRPRGIALRGCQPRDLIEHALAIARYRDQPRQLTIELLGMASASYFIEQRDLATA